MSGQDQNENDPLIGTTFADRYNLVSRLGKGGMAVVYKALDKNLGREVAIKVLRKDIAGDPIAAKRLIREARAAASLHHPHIITIHDVGESHGTVYVVMEILVGKPLSDVMEEAGAMGVERSLKVAEQLLSALTAAHNQNIVHRDIKPENIFLLSAGGGDFVKVLDFSIAKLPTEMVTAALTRAGSVFGTPHYMAPEQVEGKDVGPQTDLYAAGAVIYEMISGEPPFDGASVIDILLKHVKSAPPLLSKLGIKLPAGLSELVVRLLAKKKQDRPQTATAAREEIAKMLAEVRHDNEAVAGHATIGDLNSDVSLGLQVTGLAAARSAAGAADKSQAAAGTHAGSPNRPASAPVVAAVVEPEARTVAVDTAAVTAGLVAARAKALSSGMSPVAAMTIDIDDPIPLDLPGDGPGDLPDGPPADLPSGPPVAEKRKFVSIGDDHNEQRTIVGVGLGKMVAEMARQRAAGSTGATGVPPIQMAPNQMAPTTTEPGGQLPPQLHKSTGSTAVPHQLANQPAQPNQSTQSNQTRVPSPPLMAPPSDSAADHAQPDPVAASHSAVTVVPHTGAVATPQGGSRTGGVEAPGAIAAGSNRAVVGKPPPPPTGSAHATMARRPPPGRPVSAVAVDDRATTQPGIGLEAVSITEPQGGAAETVSTQVVRISKVSGTYHAAPVVADKPFLPKPVIIAGLIFAVLAVTAALWLLARS